MRAFAVRGSFGGLNVAAHLSADFGGVFTVARKLLVDRILNLVEPVLFKAVLDHVLQIGGSRDVDPRALSGGPFVWRQLLVALDTDAVDFPVSAAIIFDFSAAIDEARLNAVGDDQRQFLEL